MCYNVLAFFFFWQNYKHLEDRDNISFLFHPFNINQSVWYVIGACNILWNENAWNITMENTWVDINMNAFSIIFNALEKLF